MGAWNLTTCLVLVVVFLNNVQALESVLMGNSSLELNREIRQELREFAPGATEEDALVAIDYLQCVAKWKATIGEPCISESQVMSTLERLYVTYGYDMPGSELKVLAIHRCQRKQKCSAAGKCECKDSSSCHLWELPEKDLAQNCDREINALGNLLTRLEKTGSSATDPIRYIMVMSLIIITIMFVGTF